MTDVKMMFQVDCFCTDEEQFSITAPTSNANSFHLLQPDQKPRHGEQILFKRLEPGWP